ncbi:glycoside hydrolase family 3 N-terminal domain-containing protein [Pseudonocardia humida]|uniref:Fibronectin type III-like domain-contianing protein n=1 Tax=Pseudonocardia humida TaxID=2800819 RepID=A0ABT0ZSC0_9PSEU|nr:glycoside hydrolase family 3 N-terminal domain-containing protein [Pseudonocardia humida]MCO1653598.1 fibronectin type III-like domain-contianing protein [Pseudonocardia humida]
MGGPAAVYRDPGAPPAHRTRDLLARMSLAQKAAQVVTAELGPTADAPRGALLALEDGAAPAENVAAGLLRVTGTDPDAVARAVRDAQRHALTGTAPGIPALPVMAAPLPGQEPFPPPLGLAAGWDTALVRRVAGAVARRARALGVRLVLGPVVSVPAGTEPGPDRFGGDPLLAAELTAAHVQGLQEGGEVGGAVLGLGTDADATVGERMLRSRLLPPARAAVLAGVAAVVPAATANGRVPAHADPWLLRTVLRGEWGFTGAVLGDRAGVAGLHEPYRVAASPTAALALAVESGVDAVCPTAVETGATGTDGPRQAAERLLELVRRGGLPEWQLDDAVAAVLGLKFRLGLFEDPFPRAATAPTDATGRTVAAAGAPAVPPPDEKLLDATVTGGAVLLSDPRRLLPLRHGRCAVVALPGPGPADALAAALRRHLAPRRTTVPVTELVPARRGEPVIVVSAGPPAQATAEITRLAAAGLGCVLLLTGPRLDGLEPVLATLSGVLWCCGAGPATAERVADMLTGARTPSGRLPVSLGAGRGVGTPLGHGRSYAAFEYSGLLVGPERVRAGETVQVSCRVQNAGALPGREVVQVYVRDRVASVVRPDQSLAAFSSIGLAPGEGRDVRLLLPADRFAIWDRGMRRIVEPGVFDVLVGRSARDVLLAAELVVLPDDRPPPARGARLS